MEKNKQYPILSKMPYYRTQVAIEQSEVAIKKLLKKYGASPVQWTELSYKSILRFGIKVQLPNHPGMSKEVAVIMDIPVIKARKSPSNSKLVTVPREQVYRMFYFALKSTLEATAFGIFKMEDIFYAFTFLQFPGESKPVRVKDRLESQLLLSEGSGSGVIQ